MITIPTSLTEEQANQLTNLLNKLDVAMKEVEELGIFKDKQHQQN